jgi:hypothetical protein
VCVPLITFEPLVLVVIVLLLLLVVVVVVVVGYYFINFIHCLHNMTAAEFMMGFTSVTNSFVPS